MGETAAVAAVATARAAARSRSRRRPSRTTSIRRSLHGERHRAALARLHAARSPIRTQRDIEKDRELIPGLAEELPTISEDGKTYELKLRKGLKYSDGSPVKASDFEHAIKRVLNLESGGSAFFLGIEGAQDYIDAGECEGDIKRHRHRRQDR